MASCDTDLWRVFCSVRTETRVCQSSVLRAVRMVLDPVVRERWPKDRRALDALISRAGGFRTRVIRRVRIDLTDRSIEQPIEFLFIDPIYAWASTALHVSRSSPLHFRYRPLHHPSTGERLYGASVKCGEIMRQACARVRSRYSRFRCQIPSRHSTTTLHHDTPPRHTTTTRHHDTPPRHTTTTLYDTPPRLHI